MTEQWFLDLDGVRSGPYQTPEVMSLIAEGEVLPHHRISVGLREQRWTTILDWRLEQAKIPQSTEAPPTPFSTSKSEVSSIVGLEKDCPPIEVAPLPGLVPQSETNFGEGTSSIAQKITPVTAPAAAPPSLPPPRHPPPQVPSLSSLAIESNRSAPKRDAMAEMFDILQITKQKREGKQQSQTTSQPNSQQTEDFSIPPPQPESSKFGRTSLIGMGITLIGFALGQLFQQTTPPKDIASANFAKSPPSNPSTIPTSATTMVTSPPPAGITEIIDRSTDKMTIKGKVERKPEASPSPTPLKIISRTTVTHKEAPEPVQNEKEIEELQKLKSELRALHALKEKNGGVLDESDDPIEGDDFDSSSPTGGERKVPTELDQFPVR